jgi:5-(carboxyamino)imidazole ribonucleotide synthase
MSNKTIGILGGGQLGRMLALAGYPLGLRFRFFDPATDACAGHVGELYTGQYDDAEALARFANGVDVITYEFENVPVDAARLLMQHAPVYPPPAALEKAQDRLIEKEFFTALGIPTPFFQAVDSVADLEEALAHTGFPAVLKTRRFGYDGKGQIVLRQGADIAPAWEQLGGVPLILEGFVDYQREVSIIAARTCTGAFAWYPLAENEHDQGILARSRPAQAGAALQSEAVAYARRVLEALDYVGVLGIEFFQENGYLLANEMAPRVHNSGHWTIEGAQTSQFENHLRAILGLSPGDTTLVEQVTLFNLIGSLPDLDAVLAVPGAHLHLYDKAPRPGRKIGHITLRTADRQRFVDGMDTLARLIVNQL